MSSNSSCRGIVGLPAMIAIGFLRVALSAAPAAAQPPGAEVTGPIGGGTHGAPFGAAAPYVPLSAYNYVESEFFFQGTARAFTSSTSLGSNGVWNVTASTSASYKTRMIVRRPADPERFNGTVIVEWLNVSGFFDLAPDFIYANEELLRKGFAYVGVSAQFIGVEGNFVLGANYGLKSWDPERYGSLSHPGDSYAYDIFTQAAEAIRNPGRVDPLAGLKVRRIIADGESQSASYMTTYTNAIQPVTKAFDGFLIHSRGASGAPLSQAPLAVIAAPTPTFIRADLNVPVLVFETETDLLVLNFLPARQSDTLLLRTWEVPGTSHADAYDVGLGQAYTTRDWPTYPQPHCTLPFNAGPEHLIMNTAVRALDAWVRDRIPPRHSPQITLIPGPVPQIARDSFGNALGGIRTPELDVPTATLSGVGNTPSGFCALFGTTIPFTDATLESLYPSPHDYIDKTAEKAFNSVKAGFLLPIDALKVIENAKASGVGVLAR
jgi:hypothetical protein